MRYTAGGFDYSKAGYDSGSDGKAVAARSWRWAFRVLRSGEKKPKQLPQRSAKAVSKSRDEAARHGRAKSEIEPGLGI
jgi:hypothetical protein